MLKIKGFVIFGVFTGVFTSLKASSVFPKHVSLDRLEK